MQTTPVNHNSLESAIRKSASFDADFWLRVEKRGADECWPWLGRCSPSGYGRARWLAKSEYAHRVAYRLAVGPIADDLFVIHSCDNPPCCNPLHLRLATAGENMRDRDRKGRSRYGPNAPRLKLSLTEVVRLRAEEAKRREATRRRALRRLMNRRLAEFTRIAEPLVADGASLVAIAHAADVSVKTATKFCRLGGLAYDKKRRMPLSTGEFISFVKNRRMIGLRILDMARELGVSKYMVRKYMKLAGIPSG